MSSFPHRIPAILAGILILFLAACSTPPRGRGAATNPESSSTAAADRSEGSSTDSRYDFEDEGEIPEAPGDVAFEEDQLPPRPEDMEATPLDAGEVDAQDVGERGDPIDLPEPVSDAGPTPIEPQVTTPVSPTVTTPVPSGSSTRVVRGFRVQLFAVAEHARAENMARDARQRLDIEVHVVSEPPYFKVRAGDFVDRGDAVVMKERAAALGFDGAWVVTDQIEVPK